MSEFSYQNRPKPRLDLPKQQQHPKPFGQQQEQQLSFLELKQKQLEDQKRLKETVDQNRSFWDRQKQQQTPLFDSSPQTKKKFEPSFGAIWQPPTTTKEQPKQQQQQQQQFGQQQGRNKEEQDRKQQQQQQQQLQQQHSFESQQQSYNKFSSFSSQQKQESSFSSGQKQESFLSGQSQSFMSKEEIYSSREEEFEKLMRQNQGGKKICEEKEFERLYNKNFDDGQKEQIDNYSYYHNNNNSTEEDDKAPELDKMKKGEEQKKEREREREREFLSIRIIRACS